MSKPGRFDMKLDPKMKRGAEKNLDKVGFPDLSAFARRCFELLSNGTAQTIPQLCLENEPYVRIHEQPEL